MLLPHVEINERDYGAVNLVLGCAIRSQPERILAALRVSHFALAHGKRLDHFPQKLFQIGTELLDRRDRGELTGPRADLDGVKADVNEMTRTLQQTSICGLGYVAPIPLATALAYFDDDLRKKPEDGKKPRG